MKEYPILFQPDMVRAILEGRKIQTRRLTGLKEINLSPDQWEEFGSFINADGELINQFWNKQAGYVHNLKCPYGPEGSVLWVRETWRKYNLLDENGYFGQDVIDFAADNPEPMVMHDGDGFRMYDKKGNEKMIPFRPSIHLKKEDARFYLQSTGVQIQRLQDISEGDAIAEGIQLRGSGLPGDPVCYQNYSTIGAMWCHTENDKRFTAVSSFRSLIEKINGPGVWDQNPWVRAISFRILSTTGRPENLDQLCEVK